MEGGGGKGAVGVVVVEIGDVLKDRHAFEIAFFVKDGILPRDIRSILDRDIRGM